MNENKIIKLEEELRKAMINSDVETLDKLISDELTFLTFDGDIATKEMDLLAHKNKIQKLEKMDLSELEIKIMGSIAVTTVIAKIEGTFLDANISGNYRYMRIWEDKFGKTQIVAGAISKIENL